MPTKWDDLYSAYLYVSGGAMLQAEACISKADGRVFTRSDDTLDIDEWPEDYDEGGYVSVPSQRELDLGRRLVARFAEEVAPRFEDDIDDIFRKRGAYGRFKSFLEGKRLLQTWYDFENAETEKALRAWAAENGIELEG